MARDYWAEDGELIQAQSVQPPPRMQPGPINQDALRGYGSPRPQVRPRPVEQPAAQLAPPVPAQAPPQQDAAPADATEAWFNLMAKHGVDKGKWPDLVDQVYAADRHGMPPRTGKPDLDADLSAYAKRFTGIGRFSEPPAAAPQPGPAPQAVPAPQAQMAAAAPAQRDAWSDDAGGQPQRAPLSPVAPPAPQANPNAEPDAPTWLGRRIQDIRGKQDPRYSNLPNIATVLQNEGGHSLGGEIASWALGASDKDMSKTYQAMLGRRYIGTEQDANGYPVIVYRGQDGKEARAYVNNPGFDAQDVLRGAYGALPFVGAGLGVNAMLKGAPLLGRAGGQAMGQAGASLAQDAGAFVTGVSDLDQAASAAKAGIAAAAGAGGEVAGAAINALVRKFITEPRLFNAAAGTLTQEGEAAAKAAGIDPAEMSKRVAQDFSKAFAKTGDADAAFRQAASNEAGIRRSAGELTGNRQQLMREQQMRMGTYGTAAREQVENFDKLQRDDVVRAVRGVSPPGAQSPTIPSQLAPGRNYQIAQGVGKAEAGENIAGNNAKALSIAKGDERATWEAVPRLKATPDTLQEMDGIIANTFQANGGVMVDDAVTPMAAKMAKELEQFKAGQVPSKAASILPDSPAGDVQMMRKRLSAIRQSAQTPEDKRAAGALYEAFLDWEVAAAEKSGDIMAASLSRIAREKTRDLHTVFDGQKGTPAARILSDVLKKADTPEQIVNALFTGPTAEIKGGSLTAVRSLRGAYDRYLEPAAAKAAWDDIRLAYWLKMTSDKGNEAKNPASLASAIKNMLGTQASVARELYTPAEIATMRRLAMAMDEIKRKNPNTSWSAAGIGALMRDVGNSLLTLIGWNSTLVKTAGTMAFKPVAGAYGATQAAKATGSGSGASLPALPAPSFGGYGGALGDQSQQ